MPPLGPIPRVASLVLASSLVVASCGSSGETTRTSGPMTTDGATRATLPPLPQPVAPPPDGSTDPARIVARVRIPRLDLDRDVWFGVSQSTIDRGVAWWPGTAEPGQLGNVVLAGHRTDPPRPFFRIDELIPGDEIILEAGGMIHTYAVTGTEIVPEDALWIVDQTYAHLVTIFACHPLYSTAQRIVVRGELVDSSPSNGST